MQKNSPIDIIKSSIDSACEAKTAINIEFLIFSVGVELDKKAKLAPDVAGQIELLPAGDRYKISVNSDDHYYRQRFTMAHELGHFLFHSSLIGNGISDNKAYRSTCKGTFNNANITDEHETEANRFAANVLMPMELIRALSKKLGIELKSIDNEELEKLSKSLQVSKQALAIRLGV